MPVEDFGLIQPVIESKSPISSSRGRQLPSNASPAQARVLADCRAFSVIRGR